MTVFLHAGDWVLGAREFNFTQKGFHSEAEKSLLKMIPSLILEQLNTEASRVPPVEEMNARQYESLLQARQALFLELSAAIKRRDSVVVQETNQRTIKKKIAEEEKKIQEIQKKIQDNLDESEKYMSATVIQSLDADSEAEILPGAEKLVIYKGDSSSLFVPSEDVLKEGIKSRRYEKAVIDSKINALISGSITIYDRYMSVSTEITLYPGAKTISNAMEVGSMDDISRIARSLAQKLLPVIVNTSGTVLHFE
ncbi:MAG: hypothetical protein J5857_04305, partial [Treponema sp.]|nr:hypothetical protein [Treponema sp.]